MREEIVGTVRHYYSHIGVAAITLKGELRVGDKIHVKGHTSDFVQQVDSIEKEHHKVREAHSDESIGIRVKEHSREHDEVYKIIEEE